MKRMIVVKVDQCVGCKNCEIACAVEHSETKDLASAIRENPAPVSRICVEQGSGFSVPMQCRQCEDASCVFICPTHALFRKERGTPVLLDAKKCVGCKWCILACPFGAIELDESKKVVVKCDQCNDLVENGGFPACVSSCPTRALEFIDQNDVSAGKRGNWLVAIERNLSEKQKDLGFTSNEI